MSASSYFHLKLVACDRVFFNGMAEICVLPGVGGEIGIMAHHEPCAIAIETGELRIRDKDGNQHIAVVSDGMASVANNRMTVVVYSAEKPEEIDVNRAIAAKERAMEQLRQKQSIMEYHISSASLSRAMARLKESNKYTH